MLVPFDEKLKDIALKIKDIAYKLGLIADYIIEEGVSGKWRYEKFKSGKLKAYFSGYLSFASGYVIVNIALANIGIYFRTDNNNDKSAIILANERYIGDKRSADVVLNAGAIDSNGIFTLYGRAAGATLGGSYYVDIVIDGYCEEQQM